MKYAVLLSFAALTLGACTHTTERERVVVEPQRGSSTVVVPGTTTPGRTNETTVVVPR
ncbi:MAG TPA: hypothetical protein VM491_22020 [Burkholderiaceae bacterium]|nr:hypothetical protein [Burkholderiaceae bacterium]